MLGYASVLCAGEEIGQVELVAAEPCNRSGWLSFLDILKTIFTSKIFLTAVAVVIIVIAALTVFSIHDTRRRRRLFNSKMPEEIKGTENSAPLGLFFPLQF